MGYLLFFQLGPVESTQPLRFRLFLGYKQRHYREEHPQNLLDVLVHLLYDSYMVSYKVEMYQGYAKTRNQYATCFNRTCTGLTAGRVVSSRTRDGSVRGPVR